ncbi:MAG: imidazole glycerol phosphate synthase subunit HisH [Oscillatoriales cyanobacterium SM2_2_1]|nr:imidazole glycerol phosphate synthase subunit HisH [Oscillatoriales cyanobacterium SM2_2_1]
MPTPRLAVIDYDMGNLHSVCKGLAVVGAEPMVTTDPQVLLSADGVVLPGVGAFDPTMRGIRDAGLEASIRVAIAQNKPFLGICMGLQALFASSEEGREQGLSLLPGRVKRFHSEPGLTIPHMGWNQLQLTQPDCPLWQGIPGEPWMYFVHSYYPEPLDPGVVAATVTYGSQTVPVAIAHGSLMAVQFHPEKSGADGIQILRNFVRYVSGFSTPP